MRGIHAAAVVASAVFSCAAAAQTALGTAFTYQGELRSGGVAATGPHDVQFRLFNAAAGGTQVGSTVCVDGVVPADGRFAAVLDFGAAAFNGEARWVEIAVRADAGVGNCGSGVYTTLSPRQALTATPYALQTRGIQVNDNLNVGIGTAPAANAKVFVGDTVFEPKWGLAVRGSYFESGGIYACAGFSPGPPPPPTRVGVWGDSTSPEEGAEFGVIGSSLSGTGMGAFTRFGAAALVASNTNPTLGTGVSASAGGLGSVGVRSYGAGWAFHGISEETQGVGIEVSGQFSAILHGRAILDNGTDNALAFRGLGETAFDVGIGHPASNTITLRTSGAERARLTADGALLLNVGAATNNVRFHSFASDSAWFPDFGAAITGENADGVATEGLTSTGYGIVGACQTGGYAGFFVGRTQVFGDFAATTKSFLIDHPLDPANRYLEHSCVESDQRANLYRGNVRLDDRGEAIVTLPEWFGALNENFAYMLTAVGASMPGLFVADEVKENQFRIAGGLAGAKVSWMVTGERRDAYSVAHPMIVERDKGEDRGRYLTPVEHGAPEGLRIGPGLVKR